MDTLPLHSVHQRSGAVFGHRSARQVVLHYGDATSEYAAARFGAVRVDLSFRDALRITGEDRHSFLHGMCTNDINALPEWGVTYAAMVTVKGAMVADARIARRTSDVVLDLEPSQYAKVREFLEKYLISEDAELHDGREELAVIGLVGPRSFEVLRTAFGLGSEVTPVRSAFAPPGTTPTMAPVTVGFEPRTVSIDGASLVLLPSLLTRGEGVDLLLPRPLLEQVWTKLGEAGARECGVDALEWVRVEDGVPRFGLDMVETTIPLEAGMLHAINYNKGCYVGQEVIARATFRGQMNKRLVGVALGDKEPAAGTELRVEGKRIGHLTSVVRSPARSEFVGLGYVHRAHLTPGTQVLLGETDQVGKVEELPLVRPNRSL